MVLTALAALAADVCKPPLYEASAELGATYRWLWADRQPDDPWAGAFASIDARYGVVVADVTWSSDWTETVSARVGLAAISGKLRVAAGAGYALDYWAHPGSSLFAWASIGYAGWDKRGRSGLFDYTHRVHPASDNALTYTGAVMFQASNVWYGLGMRSVFTARAAGQNHARAGLTYTLASPVVCAPAATTTPPQ